MKRLSDLFGRYSLPSVMGRLGHGIANWFHHDGGGEPGNYPISQVPGLTQQPFTTYNGFSTNGFTNPNVGGDPYTAPVGGNPFVNSQDGAGSTQHYDPFGQFVGGSSSGSGRSGTLGNGYVVDPRQWGQFGLGGDSGEQDSTGRKSQFATRMGEGGLGGFGSGLLASGFFPHGGYDSSGINPGGMYTGGNAPAQPMSMGTGGSLPPSALSGLMGGKLPPQAGRI